MNGYMTVTAIVTTRDGQHQAEERRYELGDAAVLLRAGRYGVEASLLYGLRFTAGRIGLPVPPHWDQDVKSLHELRETISRGEEHFRQQQLLAARDRALIDQILAENPHLRTADQQ